MINLGSSVLDRESESCIYWLKIAVCATALCGYGAIAIAGDEKDEEVFPKEFIVSKSPRPHPIYPGLDGLLSGSSDSNEDRYVVCTLYPSDKPCRWLAKAGAHGYTWSLRYRGPIIVSVFGKMYNVSSMPGGQLKFKYTGNDVLPVIDNAQPGYVFNVDAVSRINGSLITVSDVHGKGNETTAVIAARPGCFVLPVEQDPKREKHEKVTVSVGSIVSISYAWPHTNFIKLKVIRIVEPEAKAHGKVGWIEMVEYGD